MKTSYDHHISLIGGQTHPNYFGFKWYPAKHLHLIRTKKTIDQSIRLSNVCKALQKDVVIHFHTTEGSDFDDITKVATSLLETIKSEESVLLNFTGGTKPMSIFFSDVFSRQNADRLYVDTDQGKCRFINHDGHHVVPQPNAKTDLETYAKLNGLLFDDFMDENEIYKYSELSNFLYLNHEGYSNNGIRNYLSAYKQDNQHEDQSFESRFREYKSLDIEIVKDARDVLVTLNLIGNNEQFRFDRESFLIYITGGWFEQWVFLQFDRFEVFDDVACNVKLKPQSAESDKDFTEIDILGVRNNTLWFIDCKTGSISQDAVQKMYGNGKRYGGPFARKSFVTLLGATKTSKNDAKERERCDYLGINVVSNPDLIDKLKSFVTSTKNPDNSLM